MDPNNDVGRNIVLQTNVVTIQTSSSPSVSPSPQPSPSPPPPPSLPLPSPIMSSTTTTTTVEVNPCETNGKHSPAAALSPSSIILSPCDYDPNNGTNTTDTDDEYDEVKRFFDKKMHVIEKWLRDRATPDIQSKLHEATDTIPKSPKLRTSSVTSDLFQQWLASSPVQVWFFSIQFHFVLFISIHCTRTCSISICIAFRRRSMIFHLWFLIVYCTLFKLFLYYFLSLSSFHRNINHTKKKIFFLQTITINQQQQPLKPPPLLTKCQYRLFDYVNISNKTKRNQIKKIIIIINRSDRRAHASP